MYELNCIVELAKNQTQTIKHSCNTVHVLCVGLSFTDAWDEGIFFGKCFNHSLLKEKITKLFNTYIYKTNIRYFFVRTK